ncbi:hypothetical protein EOL70_16510 [Leucothrix sargassi]|nr:hypothetical protein EOL70_16510 [Leucothrix sargassi]
MLKHIGSLILLASLVGCIDEVTSKPPSELANNDVEYTPASAGSSVILTDADLDEFSLIRNESIGGLKVDMTISEFLPFLPCSVEKGEPVLWEGIGEIIQEWRYDECGVNMQLSTIKADIDQAVSSITVVPPNDFKTARGISIGSTEEEVFAAYEDQVDPTVSELGETFVAGSIYGGLVFTFKEGKVVKMFLGGGAE